MFGYRQHRQRRMSADGPAGPTEDDCNFKHLRCTACMTASTVCQQEDRHHQTLTPHGHTEHIEWQLLQCDALLKWHYPGFTLDNLNEVYQALSQTFQFAQNPPPGPSSHPFPLHTEVPQLPPAALPKGPSGSYDALSSSRSALRPSSSPHVYAGSFSSDLQPAHLSSIPVSSAAAPRYADPLSHDLSNTRAPAKTFGVNVEIVTGLKLPAPDKEDLTVGSSGLTSGRDRDPVEPSAPRDQTKWVSVQVHRNSITAPSPPITNGAPPATDTIHVWLPKDCNMVQKILDVYFTWLNFHRPVFMCSEFEQMLNALYDGRQLLHDAGYICSVYLVLTLSTLSELNHHTSSMEKEGGQEFFKHVLFPDLHVSLSSLQVLIHQGWTLWHLVGSLVRITIELGLHYNPTLQQNTFSEEECQLRIWLWTIVLLYDRGTSILLGHLLAIALSDSNMPQPSQTKSTDVSKHFVLSAPITEIQVDIINLLYVPIRQSADAIMCHVTQIIKSMASFRQQLPENYQWFFGGMQMWPLECRMKLVQDITEDQRLMLSSELDYNPRLQALTDAIITSHNIIIMYNQLICFPDITFFVSPILLHITAMVILYGHMSHCHSIMHQVALGDIFPWRWECKDLNGGHPLIMALTEKVLNVNLQQVTLTTVPMLISEYVWDKKILSPKGVVQADVPLVSPLMGPVQYGGTLASPFSGQPLSENMSKGSPGHANMGGTPRTPVDKKLLKVPAENQNVTTGAAAAAAAAAASMSENGGQDFNDLLVAAAASQPIGTFGYQLSHESYMLEEKDMSIMNRAMQMWHVQRPVAQQFTVQPQQQG
ncbi:uncharacterized protein LAESUDRAFT_736136 [Laetiporus sulphureus 93-53]|uniref:Xylanolytic transcriptional activator regulatory domain-containing protein n=1 Tax=Laetiporus sulphureus 93-53 TaxID=1314785 RepID=A0A165EVC1_9APHY|nr:uncharacterized protein LAESUDRAFT_736136 [Laetiporus sulphureus 93-53]KZT07839.1 hypothetical protein LAESUDRAFT_736136 [Laetiporus sulphureus 93-53]